MSDCSCHINPPCNVCTDACCGEHDSDVCGYAPGLTSACCDDCPDWKDL